METELAKSILDIDKKSWTLVKFGDVVTEPRDTCKDIVAEGIEHVVGLEHIDAEDIHLRKSAGIEESTTFTKKFQAADVLFGRRRAYLKKAAQASFSGICSGDITVLRSKKNLLTELLPFIVNNDKFFDHAIKHSAGGLSPRVKFKDLANYEFLLPPKAEQARLAKLLWALDEVIEREREVLKRLNFFLLVTEIKYFNSGSNIGLKEIIIKTLSGGTPDTTIDEYYSNGSIPWITTKILENNFIANGEKLIAETAVTNSAAKILPEGNILAGTRVGIGKFAINKVDMSFSQDVTGLILDHQKVDSEFLVYQLNSEVFRRKIAPLTRGTTIKGITKDELLNIKIFLPKISQQLEVRDKLRSIRASIEQIKNNIELGKSVQSSLINQIF